MTTFFERWRIARELDTGERRSPTSDASASGPASHARSIERVDELLRAGAEELRGWPSPRVAERVLARIDQRVLARIEKGDVFAELERRSAPSRARRIAIAASVLVAASLAWLAWSPSRLAEPPSTSSAAQVGTQVGPQVATALAARDLLELPRGVSANLRANVDEPLIAEAMNLGSDATHLAQFLAGRVSRPWSAALVQR